MLNNIKNISSACVKCGKCIQSCTVYDIKKDETNSPRGFLDLISAYKDENLKLDKGLKKVFESCFLCTRCVEVCPSNIRVDTAIEAVRFDIAKQMGIAWYKKIMLYLLSHRKVMDLAAKFGYVFQSCAFKIQDNSMMRAKFSLPMIKKDRLLIAFKKKSFLNSNPNFIDNKGEKSIALFVGCLANYSYTSTAFSILKIAKKLNINVDLMQKQVCCGAPHYFTGDFKTVESLAKKNISYFEEKLKKVEAIIIPEATCSAMIRVDYEHFFKLINDEEWAKRARKVSERIFIASKYFYEFTPLLQVLQKLPKKDYTLTYHDPCHSKKMQGYHKEVRELLKVNFKFKELEDTNSCCGFGGLSMQSDYYDEALKVGLKRVKDIEKSEAQILSAECSACRMQLSNALHQSKSNTNFKAPLELIASCFDET